MIFCSDRLERPLNDAKLIYVHVCAVFPPQKQKSKYGTDLACKSALEKTRYKLFSASKTFFCPELAMLYCALAGPHVKYMEGEGLV